MHLHRISAGRVSSSFVAGVLCTLTVAAFGGGPIDRQVADRNHMERFLPCEADAPV